MNKIIYPLDKNRWYHWGKRARRKPMSLAVCLKNGDAIVMATDSREVLSNQEITVYNDNVYKIEDLGNSLGLISIGDDVEFADWLLSYVKENFLNKIDKTTNYSQLTNQLSLALREQYEQHTMNSGKVASGQAIEFILCGFASSGMPKITVLANFLENTKPFEPRAAIGDYFIGGKCTVALHFIKKLEKVIHICDLDVDSLKRLATFLICEVAEVEAEVKPPIQLAVLKANQPMLHCEQEEVQKIIKEASPLVSNEQLLKFIANK